MGGRGGNAIFSHTWNRPLRGNVIYNVRSVMRADGTAIRDRRALLMHVIMPENEHVIDYGQSDAHNVMHRLGFLSR